MVFIAVTLIGILIFASPTLALIITAPVGEQFSELYMLGPNHTFDDIPFNVKVGVEYSVYLGVGNHMGQSSYYTCIVKFRNETEPLPNTQLGTPSPLLGLYEFNTFIQDEQSWETPLTFKVNDFNFSEGKSQISSVSINGLDFPVNEASMWNSNRTGYYYGLFVELWLFNSTLGVSQFHNRSVYLTLNVTQ